MQPDSPPGPVYYCKVCNLPTDNKLRCGAAACDACKKFFLRNFAKLETMRCSSGTFACLSQLPLLNSNGIYDGSRAVQTSSGATLRLMCSRCRLSRCYEIGMQTGKSSPPSTPPQQRLCSGDLVEKEQKNIIAQIERSLLTTLLTYFEHLNVAAGSTAPIIATAWAQLQVIRQFSDMMQSSCSISEDDPAIAKIRINKLVDVIRFIEQETTTLMLNSGLTCGETVRK